MNESTRKIELTLEEEFFLQDAIEARISDLQNYIEGTNDEEIITAAELSIKALEAIRERIEAQ